MMLDLLKFEILIESYIIKKVQELRLTFSFLHVKHTLIIRVGAILRDYVIDHKLSFMDVGLNDNEVVGIESN